MKIEKYEMTANIPEVGDVTFFGAMVEDAATEEDARKAAAEFLRGEVQLVSVCDNGCCRIYTLLETDEFEFVNESGTVH